MKVKNSKEKKKLTLKSVIRWLIYYILIFFAFIFMTSGTMLKPIILIPLALCIAVGNNIIISAITGAVCGFLIDISCDKLIGYNAIILTVFCAFVTLIFELYLRNKFINILILSAILSFIHGFWNYENVDQIFSKVTVPVWIYTVISTIFVYLIIKLINHFLMPKEHLSLEDAIKMN